MFPFAEFVLIFSPNKLSSVHLFGLLSVLSLHISPVNAQKLDQNVKRKSEFLANFGKLWQNITFFLSLPKKVFAKVCQSSPYLPPPPPMYLN